MGLSAGMMLLAVVVAAYGAGDRPLLSRLVKQNAPPAPATDVEQQNAVAAVENQEPRMEPVSTAEEKRDPVPTVDEKQSPEV